MGMMRVGSCGSGSRQDFQNRGVAETLGSYRCENDHSAGWNLVPYSRMAGIPGMLSTEIYAHHLRQHNPLEHPPCCERFSQHRLF
jgi:hypothetical protein